jgi:hypothetical protein
MHTLNIQTKITRKNHVLHVDLKNVVPDGDYDVLVVLEEVKNKIKKPIRLHTTDTAIDPDLRFDRDEIYGENGR